MKKWTWGFLLVMFLISLGVRLINFKESIYFGYDEAMDWYRSQEIYLQKDIKIQGMPATGNLGIFHGPLNWYLIGLAYSTIGWDIEKFQIIMRVINSLMVVPVFIIASSVGGVVAGMMASLLFAVSFSSVQYSYFIGNATFGFYAWILIGLGISALLTKKYKKLTPILLFAGAGLALQSNLLLFYVNLAVIAMIWLARKEFLGIGKRWWLIATIIWTGLISSFAISEVKYGFRNLKTLWMMKQQGLGIKTLGESPIIMYLQKYIDLYKDNLGAEANMNLFWVVVGVIITIYLFKKRKNVWAKILLIWMYSWIILALVFMHNGYYTHVGLGIAVIIAVGWMLSIIWEQKKYFVVVCITTTIVLVNLIAIIRQSNKSIISEIKPQPGVKYEDMKKVMDYWYTEARGKNFTVRLVGIPFKVQTLWSAVLNNYAEKKYKYLPVWELGNIEEYPGRLPTPLTGTTCVRYFTREPMRGLPIEIIESQLKEENFFSTIVETKEIGMYLVEKRLAKAKECSN